jgi:hypothetical protein
MPPMDTPEFTLNRFASFDGTELAWHEAGEGRPVVLLHGLFSNAQTNWIRYGHAKLLVNNNFRVVMPDLRAHGLSAKPHESKGFPVDVLTQDCLSLIAHLGLSDYDLGGYSLGASGNDTLISIEGLIGGRFSDILVGDANNNQFEGGLQDDRIEGGAGIDTAIYAAATGGVWVNLAVTGTLGAEGNDTLIGIENVVGSSSSDILLGDSSANQLEGGGGDDLINGAGGDDFLIGGPGADMFVVGPGSGRESAITSLQSSGLNIKTIEDVTPIPHNGCRPRKKRRV